MALLILSTNVQAEMIDVGNIKNIFVADSFIGSSNSADCETSQTAANCDFEQSFWPDTYLSNTALEGIATSDYRTSVKSPVEGNAYIDLKFTDSMYGGAGNDLVLFFVGNSRSFGLDVSDKQNTGLISTGTYNISTSDTVFNDDSTWKCISKDGTDNNCSTGYPLSAVFFDFGESFDGVEIGKIHLTFGEGFSGIAGSANFALAGGFHNSAVVPLPLPIVLFSSGLALLGWAGRRKKV